MIRTAQAAQIDPDLPRFPRLPQWIVDRSAPQTLESAGFASGSALALLHMVLHDDATRSCTDLLKQRLALRAAIHCLKLQGRNVTQSEIRDAFVLATPGAPRGPDGDMLAFWKRAVRVSLRRMDVEACLSQLLPETIAKDAIMQFNNARQTNHRDPAISAIAVCSELLRDHPREEASALLLADMVLANLLGWKTPIPLLSLRLGRPDLRRLLIDGDYEGFAIAGHFAFTRAAADTVRQAHQLARLASDLLQIAPKLRAKGAQNAVQLFLSEDAIFPSTMLSPVIKGTKIPMSDHAARRLCDRLVTLGVVRELTGRPTFRLYGVAP